ncbi:MAG: EAL domain-containing protein [Burkholderiales bacterium]|uniref:putative bifunctional diguanylate cyclase/phosphodiesterase n=1 Tax=Inhella sp. TaxID=1921806 RepID=UPI001AD1B23E|nr:EAL domain-containing protein [Burkholderiales bacterium]
MRHEQANARPFGGRRAEVWVTLAALLLFSLLLAVAQHGQLERRFREDLAIQGRIVADNASAAILFDAAKDAAEILSALNSAPAIEEAVLRNGAGRPLAQFKSDRGKAHWLHQWAGREELRLPVQAQREVVGELKLVASRAPIWSDLLRFVGSASGLLAAALLLASVVTRRLRATVSAAEERTLHLAHHDPLTDLPNRESFRLALDEAAAHCRSRPAALLFIDLDNFKQINDSHGHLAGDRVLRRVATVLRAQCRPQDVAARLAGDEFALLLSAPLDEARATQVAAALVEELPRPTGAELPIHVSIGVALMPLHADNASDVMRWADAAMYEAKRRGKDGFQLFSEAIGASLRERLALERDLRVALEHRGLHLAYQPQFDVEGRCCGLEALARWRHAERGLVAPADFISVAESSGLIVELSLSLLEVLAADLRQLETMGLVPPVVAVNLSSRQCRQPLHREQLLEALERLDLGPHRVEFELTEGTLFEDVEAPDSMVVQLQRRGYALAIDDFGTGYSSLAYLLRLRSQKLKIDRLFIHGMSSNSESRLLVASIIGVAHALGLRVVAEGVECSADWAELERLRCDLFQGFGLARPLEVGALAGLLGEQALGQRTRVSA